MGDEGDIRYPNLDADIDDMRRQQQKGEEPDVSDDDDEDVMYGPEERPLPKPPKKDSDEVDYEVLKQMFPATHGGVNKALEELNVAIDKVGEETAKANEERGRMRAAQIKKEAGLPYEPYEEPDDELFLEETEHETDNSYRSRVIGHAHSKEMGEKFDLLEEEEEEDGPGREEEEEEEEEYDDDEEEMTSAARQKLSATHHGNPYFLAKHNGKPRRFDYQSDADYEANIAEFVRLHPTTVPASIASSPSMSTRSHTLSLAPCPTLCPTRADAAAATPQRSSRSSM